MRVRENYLIEYTNALTRLLSKDDTFIKLNESLIKNNISGYTEYHFEEVYSYAKELKAVLDKITSIVYKPHIKATVEEVVIRSELSHNLSNDSFKETMKDIKLWRNKDGEMTPEYVHTTNYIDTLVTYENQFISFLVDLINDEVDHLLNNLTPLVKSIEEQYESKGVTYGKYSLFNEFEPFTYPFNKDYLESKVSSKEVFELLSKLRKKIKHIKASEFYRFNKNKIVDKNVVPTNILIHDLLYSFCYRFYLENLMKLDADEKNKKDVYYYNYVLCEFIKFFTRNNLVKSSKSNSIIYLDNDTRLRFSEFSFKKGIYSYKVKEDNDNLGFEIEVRLINKSTKLDLDVTNDKLATYYVLTSLNYEEGNKPYIDSIIDSKKEEFIQVILATQNNINLVFDSVLNISSYQDYNDLLIKNLMSSFTMLFNTQTYIYENKCPVCGKKDVSLDEDNYHCQDCHSVYSIVNVDDKELLWIKSLRRK